MLNVVKTIHSTNSVLIQDIVHLTEKNPTSKYIFYIESYQNYTQYQISTDSRHCASY